ncbi:MAG: hypothetical protein C4308_10710 [Chitinophagaceae bacterium]
MKIFLLPAVFAICLHVSAQQTPAPAEEIMKEALLLAAQQNKNVLIIFHASWCGWCKKMDQSIEDQMCKKIFR